MHQRLLLDALADVALVPERENRDADGLTRDDLRLRSFPGPQQFRDAILDAAWTLRPEYVTIHHTGSRNLRFTITDKGRDAVASFDPDLTTFDGQARALINEARSRHSWRATGAIHPKPIELRLADMLEQTLQRRA
jgi:hypothetical protein